MGAIPEIAGNEHGAVEDLPGIKSRISRFEAGEDDVEGEVGEADEWGIVNVLSE